MTITTDTPILAVESAGAAPAVATHAGPETVHPRGPRRLASALVSLLLVGALAIAGLMIVPGLFGYERYVITGGSMTGSIDRGSVAFDQVVPVKQLAVGDVITYDPPAGAPVTHKLTHRIVWIGRGRDGSPAYRTKGDANAKADPWTFELHRRTQARVAFHVPYVGYVLSALSIRWVRMLAIGLPALLIALSLLAGLWREAGEEPQR